MVLRRYTITVADPKSGVERRLTVAVWAVCAVVAAVIAVPIVVAAATVWRANGDMQMLSARHRALEIEAANYRAALEGLIAEVGSDPSTTADGRAESAPSQQSASRDSTAPVPSSSGPAASTSTVPGSVSVSRPASVTSGSAIADSPENPEPPAAAQPVESAATTLTAEPAPRDGGTENVTREALNEAMATMTQARVLADVAEAGALSSRSYEAGVTLELEVNQLATAGRVNDALARAVEAAARFRAAEIEARAESSAAAAWERLSLDTATTPAPPARPQAKEMPEPQVTPVADIEDMIREVIAQYVRALESQNLAELKRVWPSLGGTQERAIQTEFANARTVQTQFTDPRITINGDITTVAGFRMYSLVTQDGQRLSSVTKTTITLRRSGDGWVIERVLHQQ